MNGRWSSDGEIIGSSSADTMVGRASPARVRARAASILVPAVAGDTNHIAEAERRRQRLRSLSRDDFRDPCNRQKDGGGGSSQQKANHDDLHPSNARPMDTEQLLAETRRARVNRADAVLGCERSRERPQGGSRAVRLPAAGRYQMRRGVVGGRLRSDGARR